MRDLDSDLRTCVHSFLESDPCAAWRLSATCKERRSASGLCPPVLLLKVGDNIVVMPAKSFDDICYQVQFDGKPVPVSHGMSVFSACLHRHRMPRVAFSGNLLIDPYKQFRGAPKKDGEFRYITSQFQDPLSQWKISVFTHGRFKTHRTYPAGPRDNNDYICESSMFVPHYIVSADVESMSPFDVTT